MDYTAKQSGFRNSDARKTLFGSFDGRKDAEHYSVSLADISNICAMQDDLFCGTVPFDNI